MAIKKKVAKKSNLEVRRDLIKRALPEVKKLVAKYDLASVQSAVKVLYENRRAEQELRAAEKKAADLRKRLGK